MGTNGNERSIRPFKCIRCIIVHISYRVIRTWDPFFYRTINYWSKLWDSKVILVNLHSLTLLQPLLCGFDKCACSHMTTNTFLLDNCIQLHCTQQFTANGSPIMILVRRTLCHDTECRFFIPSSCREAHVGFGPHEPVDRSLWFFIEFMCSSGQSYQTDHLTRRRKGGSLSIEIAWLFLNHNSYHYRHVNLLPMASHTESHVFTKSYLFHQ